ncbi:LuxR C-terminal-related transcriptional regulator [Leucobacter chromiireducens]|uniref:LuxR C-terminal-related transcriptional regulator n=1 Tax=Leucobacter chromiireducens TaxID=283877 RepID=UPI000F63F1FF|nr:LuxR C-terminal-related transcriptional regulator [Leucobacter chromiireducens]
MGIEALSTRMPVVAELVRALESGHTALVTGPSGSGKSHVLRDLATALRQAGRSPVEIDCADPAARAAYLDWAAADSDAATCFLIDNFERADPATLRAMIEHHARGRCTVASLETGNQRTPYLRALDHVLREEESAAQMIAAIRQFPLPPLPDHDIAWLAHELSPTLLPATTAHTITMLAAGRPAWVHDLLVLAEHDALTHLPHPGIVEHVPRELNLPGMRAIARSAGPLSPAVGTAAVLSAELGPTDLALLEEHLGFPHVRELSEQGVLTREPGSDRYAVLPFVAAALRPFASPERVAAGRRAISEHLVVQEGLGIPVSTADALRCARSLTFSDATLTQPTHRDARVRILHRATMSSVALHQAPQARGFLLRAGSAQAPLRRAAHAQVVGVLAGAAAAAEVLDGDPASASSDSDADDTETRVSALRAVLAAEAGTPHAQRTAADQVAGWWNTTEPLTTARSNLRHLSDTAAQETAALAAALLEFDTVWGGTIPRGTWLSSGAPIPPLPAVAAGADDVVAGTLLLARGLTAFLAGELALRADELFSAAASAATPEAHAHWLRHLVAAGEALACGSAERAALEWCHLERTAPRYTAMRLRSALRAIGESISSASIPGTPAGTGALTPEYFTRYLTGNHTSLRHGESPVQPGSEPLPVLRFAHAHLTAAEQQNPIELLRASQRLQRLELWAPAAFAASSARTIYLSRRTVSGVRECDERLDALEAHLTRSLPWYRAGTLPTAHFARLTPRELEVARLAARGIANAALAARLGCSVRTIESHLAQAKAKLGAQSRRELSEKLGIAVAQAGRAAANAR